MYSPYRELQRRSCASSTSSTTSIADDFLTVVLPEFVLDHWWEKALHNQSALLLRARLRARPNTIVTSLPFHLQGSEIEVVGSVEGTGDPPVSGVTPHRQRRAGTLSGTLTPRSCSA